MPVLVARSGLLGLSRQVIVTAVQYQPGIIVQLMPTGGALMAVLATAAFLNLQ
jgi:uncharacterized ion transporter superfamily protein YfcC